MQAKVFAENGGKQMVFPIVQSTLGLHRQITVAKPLVPWRRLRISTEKTKGCSTFERCNRHAVRYRIDLHLPISCMSVRVEVTVIHKSFPFQLNGAKAS